MGIGICCVAEPWNVRNDPCWFSSWNGLAAIVWNPDALQETCVLTHQARDFVVIRCGRLHVASVYISPSLGANEFLEIIDELGGCICDTEGETVVCGDFNARSQLWGDTVTNRRGNLLAEWAAQHDLGLGNMGNAPTCIRPQGTSVVDTTWHSLFADNLLRGWQVLDTETMSDHAFITFRYEKTTQGPGPGSRNEKAWRKRHPQWITKEMDEDLFKEALTLVAGAFSENTGDTNDLAKWVQEAATNACDMSARRRGSSPTRKKAYWWTPELSALRDICIRTRRKLMRLRRRREAEGLGAAEVEYRVAKRMFRGEIRKAKRDAWQELIASINRDPWGLPFKLVLSRLRRAVPRLTETVSTEGLNQMLGELFPAGETHDPIETWGEWQGPLQEECRASREEVARAITRSGRGGNPAPGPDGITVEIWKRTPREMLECLASLYTKCMQTGKYPEIWKRATLVLIPKGDVRNLSQRPKTRPICLLNEVGKLFERILIERLKSHMRGEGNRDLSDKQFGFRENRSTVDALKRAVDFIEARTGRGQLVVAVGVDIRNAFNSLPWPTIRWALERFDFPVYLRRLIDSYLHKRTIEFPTIEGRIETRRVTAGVPQGSVLGPLLWNIGFNYAIEARPRPNCDIVAYADDILVLAAGESPELVRQRMNDQLVPILRRLEQLGLTVAVEKTEATLFYPPRRRLGTDPILIRVKGEYIETTYQIKYLGIILDCKLSFMQHFRYIAEKSTKVSRALGQVMPNVRGPDERKRRLYAQVLGSAVLYGAPIWSEKLNTSEKGKRIIRAVQRSITLRVCSAYRTVSGGAAAVLARVPPFELLAMERKRVYTRVCEERAAGRLPDVEQIMDVEKLETRRQWRIQLERENAPGRITREAIAPHLDAWLDRSWGSIDHKMTQMLTGHGCFGKFLWTMQKRESPECLDCGEGFPDVPGHALFECAAWMPWRIEFREAFGGERNLRDIIGAVTQDEEKWRTFAQYVGKIIRRKIEAERARELDRARGTSESEEADEREGIEGDDQLELVRRRRRAEGSDGGEDEEEEDGRDR